MPTHASGGVDQAVVAVVATVDRAAAPRGCVLEEHEPVLDRIHLPHRSVELDRCREPALLEDRTTVLGELCRAWLDQGKEPIIAPVQDGVAAGRGFLEEEEVVIEVLERVGGFIDRHRPEREGLVTLGFTVIAGVGDLITGGNYMYLRDKPAHSSLLSLMRPWPWYIVQTAILGLFLLLAVAGLTGAVRALLADTVDAARPWSA